METGLDPDFVRRLMQAYGEWRAAHARFAEDDYSAAEFLATAVKKSRMEEAMKTGAILALEMAATEAYRIIMRERERPQ